MNRPKILALSALVAAAWCTAPQAQTPATPSNSDRSISTPSNNSSVTSPSSTDRNTSTQMRRNDTARSDSGSASKMNRSERKFLEEAAEGGVAEVELGKLASSKASNADVKKFGEQMAQDHAKANDDLKQLASQKGVQVKPDLDRSHKRMSDQLQKLSGADFDKKYMAEMVRDHEHDVKEFKKMAKDAKDPDVRAFAEKTVPVLEKHLDMARQVADATGAPRGQRNQKSSENNPARDKSSSAGSSTSASNAGTASSAKR
jgi:putative membrane protein